MFQQLKNAIAIIRQINAGEWEFKGHYPYPFEANFKCYTAERNGVELWVANRAASCEITDKPWELGVFGSLVWVFGARAKVRELERNMRRRPSDLTK